MEEVLLDLAVLFAHKIEVLLLLPDLKVQFRQFPFVAPMLQRLFAAFLFGSLQHLNVSLNIIIHGSQEFEFILQLVHLVVLVHQVQACSNFLDLPLHAEPYCLLLPRNLVQQALAVLELLVVLEVVFVHPSSPLVCLLVQLLDDGVDLSLQVEIDSR